ncbi:MAG: ABC transporter substrate-binding protein [Rectinemataceae bacterium]
MNHPKKMLALALAMISFAGLAFAQKTEITYMCWYNTTQSEAQSVQAVIDTYNNSQDKIHVTMIAVPRDGYETKVNTLAAGNQLPDCTQLSEAMALQFAAAGLLADVSKMYRPDEAPLKSLVFTYDGKAVGYSSGDEVLLLYYNKKLFDAAHLAYPPASADKAWTWKQFVEVAKKLTKDRNGKTPNDPGFDANNIVTYGCDFNRLWWMWPIVTYSNGGGLMSPDGKRLLIDKPESIEAMQALADLYVKDKVAPSFGDKNAMPSLDLTLLSNKVAMATSGQWEMGVSLNNSLKDGLEYGVGVLPKFKKAVTYNTGAPYGVFKSSKHLDAAMSFIKWYADEKNQWTQITNGILMPTTAKWYASEAAMREWADHPPRPPFAMYKTAVIDYAMHNAIQVPWYYFNGYQGLDDILSSGIEAVWNGKVTAKAYIDSIMPQLQKYFDDHKAK